MSYHAYLRRLKSIRRAAAHRYNRPGGYPNVQDMFRDMEQAWAHGDRLETMAKRLFERSRQHAQPGDIPIGVKAQ